MASTAIKGKGKKIMEIKIQINKKLLEADSLAVLAYAVEKEINKILEIKESNSLAALAIKSILQGLQVFADYHKNLSDDDYQYYCDNGIFKLRIDEELDNPKLDFPVVVSRSIDLWLQGTNEPKLIAMFRNIDNQLVIEDENLAKLDSYFN
jgi:hypothetical protein